MLERIGGCECRKRRFGKAFAESEPPLGRLLPLGKGLPCSQALLWGVLLSWDGPGSRAGRSPEAVELRPRGAQSLRTAPGSSLVSVCQRSIFLSLFFRQSNQCFSLSPLALIPNTTPPWEGDRERERSVGGASVLLRDAQGHRGMLERAG